MRTVSGQLKLSLAQYEEVAHFARFGADLDRATQQQINRGLRLREALKQPVYQPLSLAQEILFLYAVDHGYVDDLPLEEIASYEQALWRLAEREFRSVIRRIEEEQRLDDELESDIVALLGRLSETLT